MTSNYKIVTDTFIRVFSTNMLSGHAG